MAGRRVTLDHDGAFLTVVVWQDAVEREVPWPLAEIQDHGRLSSRFDLATWQKDAGVVYSTRQRLAGNCTDPFREKMGEQDFLDSTASARLRLSVCFGSALGLGEQGARPLAGGLAGDLCHWERSTGRDSHAPTHWEMGVSQVGYRYLLLTFLRATLLYGWGGGGGGGGGTVVGRGRGHASPRGSGESAYGRAQRVGRHQRPIRRT